MSKKSQAIRSVHAANNHLSGAYSTQVQRKRACLLLIEWCAKNGTPLMSLKEVTFEQVKSYLDHRQLPVEGQSRKALSVASLHNLLASIRSAMKALKGDPDKLGITAQNLGLPSRSRLGTKLPVTDAVFFKAIAIAEALGEMGYSIMLKLERYLGYRGQEALMSAAEIQKYAFELHDLIRIGNIDLSSPDGCVLPQLAVVDGSKAANPRVTASIAKYAKETLQTLAQAMRYLQTHAFLVEGKAKGLKSARQKMHALARKCGLVGQFAPHSLRYRYATDKLEELRDAGVNVEDAFKLCTKFLGHGPTRTWQVIKMVYGRTIVSTFPKARRRHDFKMATLVLEDLIAKTFPVSAPAPKMNSEKSS